MVWNSSFYVGSARDTDENKNGLNLRHMFIDLGTGPRVKIVEKIYVVTDSSRAFL